MVLAQSIDRRLKGLRSLSCLTSQQRGVYSELLVAQDLIQKKYHLKHHRHQTPYGEMDLILENQKEVLFVEVKSVTSTVFDDFRLSKRQKRRIENSFLFYMQSSLKEGRILYARVFPQDKIEYLDFCFLE